MLSRLPAFRLVPGGLAPPATRSALLRRRLATCRPNARLVALAARPATCKPCASFSPRGPRPTRATAWARRRSLVAAKRNDAGLAQAHARAGTDVNIAAVNGVTASWRRHTRGAQISWSGFSRAARTSAPWIASARARWCTPRARGTRRWCALLLAHGVDPECRVPQRPHRAHVGRGLRARRRGGRPARGGRAGRRPRQSRQERRGHRARGRLREDRGALGDARRRPPRRFAYASNEGSGTVSVIDTATDASSRRSRPAASRAASRSRATASALS